jgi:hypothetical protein
VIEDSLRAARLAVGHWPLTLSAIAAYGLFGGVFGAESMIGVETIAALIIPLALVMLFIPYYLSRRAGGPAANEVGSIGRWFGWGLLALMPMIALMAGYAIAMGFDAWSNSETPIWPESLVYTISTIIALPLLAVSTGRAIDRNGLRAAVLFNFCKANAGPLVVAGFVLLLAPNFLTDALLDRFGMEGLSLQSSIAFGVAGGLAMLLSTVLTTGLSAAIYRNAEEAAKGNRDDPQR